MPQNKMERFTKRARHVLNLAQEEAAQLGHGTIGTGHLLIGLIREGDGAAGHVLREMDIRYASALPIVQEAYQGETRPEGVSPDLAADTKRALEMAVAEARQLGHDYIGTEHLLLAILHQTDSTAHRVLQRLNTDITRVEKRVIRTIRQDERAVLRPGNKPVSSLIRQRFARMMPPASMPTQPTHVEAMKILQMIDEGKVTAEEGERLLKALPSAGSPMPRPERSIDLNPLPAEDDGQLRAVVTNRSTGETQFHISIPIQEAKDGLKNALNAIENGLTGNFLTVDSDPYRIDLYVDKPGEV